MSRPRPSSRALLRPRSMTSNAGKPGPSSSTTSVTASSRTSNQARTAVPSGVGEGVVQQCVDGRLKLRLADVDLGRPLGPGPEPLAFLFLGERRPERHAVPDDGGEVRRRTPGNS